MTKFDIILNRVDAVKKFNTACSKADFDVDVISGRYFIDGKSIMGLFSLDVSKPVACQIHTEDPEKIQAFKTEIAYCLI